MKSENETRQNELFHKPEYYDVAFSWDPSSEINLFKYIFRKHSDIEVKKLLEPGCGTGRFMVSLPNYGYTIVGYDNSAEMVKYTRKKITEHGLDSKASVMKGRMQSIRFSDKFDAAINVINSIGYLHTDEDIKAHLINTADAIRKGGLYVVQISCVYNDISCLNPERWTLSKNGIKTQTTWKIIKESMCEKKCYQRVTMKITVNGEEFTFRDYQTMRLWTYDDIKMLLKTTRCFRLAAIYDIDNRSIPYRTRITGETGNLYYVLKRI